MEVEKRGGMRRPTRVASSFLGIYAGLLGAAHGFFETMQGHLAPHRLGIAAIGPPCEAKAIWHACLPAMTIVPNFLLTGVLAIAVSLAVGLWSALFIERKQGGLVLLLLAVLMMLVGGGFVPAWAGVTAGLSRFRLDAPVRSLSRLRRFLARLWPGSAIALAVWSVGGWILGAFFNEAMLRWSLPLFVLCNLGLPVLTVVSARAMEREDALVPLRESR